MGIPVYFKTLVSKYQDTILHKGKLNDIQSIFFDLNCLIHPCCRGLTDETEMIHKILSEIQRIIDYVNPSELVYIAIDGIAPAGKMKQQRMRRFKKAVENKYSHEKTWNTNAISPGTLFMKRLNHELKEFIQQNSRKIILSDSDERGEGEHKILHYIKDYQLSGNISIYGLDADLIMLSLVSQQNNIYLLRERTEYNIEDTEEEFIYLKIDRLKDHLIDSMNLKRIISKEKIIDDYIFLCFFLGNDFMNHIPSLNLRYGGHDIILEIYSLLQERYQGYFCLIDRNLKDLIHITFLKEFIDELKQKENYILSKILSIRERQYKKIYNQYNELFHNFKLYLMEINQNKSKKHSKYISLEDIYSFRNSSPIGSEDITEMIENLPLLFYKDEKDKLKNLMYDEKECSDHFDSLVWTTHYYFGTCINWKWKTKYNCGPLISHYSKFLTNMKEIHLKQDTIEFSNEEQLAYIFPKDSHNLHEFNIQSKEYELIPDFSFNRYLWECELEFK